LSAGTTVSVSRTLLSSVFSVSAERDDCLLISCPASASAFSTAGSAERFTSRSSFAVASC
jgi:hypothetical protein